MEGRGKKQPRGLLGLPASKSTASALCLTEVVRNGANKTKREIVAVGLFWWWLLMPKINATPCCRVLENGLPSTQLVEKKAMFRVSRGFSLVKSGDLVCGSDSPVSEELSTCP